MSRRSDTESGEAKTTATEMTDRAGRGSSGKIKTFASLANPVFRIYFISMLCQTASMNMQQVTTPLLVYRITGSAVLLGVVAMAGSLPHIFFSLFGGVIADRIQKKYILLIALGAFTIVSMVLALSLMFGILNAKTWWILIINSVLQSSLMGLMIPARHAIIREIVGKEQLMNAIALNTMGGNGWRLMAPAAAGFLIDGFGFKAVYFIMAGIYALGAVLIIFLPLTSTITASTKNALGQVTEGFKYIRSEPTLLFILGFTLFTVVLAMPYQQLMSVFVDDVLKVGAKGLGILMSVSGIGAIGGALVLASLPSKKRGLMMLLGTLVLALALVVFSFSKSWALSLGIMVVIGLGQTARMTLSNTLAQSYVKDEYRGRVMGIYDMEMSFVGLSVWIAGLLTEAVSVEWAVGSFAMLLAFICIMGLLFSRRIRNLD